MVYGVAAATAFEGLVSSIVGEDGRRGKGSDGLIVAVYFMFGGILCFRLLDPTPLF